MQMCRLVLMVLMCQSVACQVYEFEFKPKREIQGTWLEFEVQTPSRADLLFVVDNSDSMADEQAALARSFSRMIKVLAPQETSYRIGIVSTDAHGFQVDCCGEQNPLVEVGTDLAIEGARGNCQSCSCAEGDDCFTCGSCFPSVEINRPHDGAKGRLLAAFDPVVFEAASWSHLSLELQSLLPLVFPSDVSQALPVVDRNALTQEACVACGCAECGQLSTCDPLFTGCVEDLTSVLVEAHLQSNLNGLGIDGFGWEEGIKSALLAVGLDPEESQSETPGYNLVASGAPNSLNMGAQSVSWLRDDAVLGVAFLTDEEDCSMPSHLLELRHQYEGEGLPEGSICYQPELRNRFLNVDAMAAQLLAKKRGAASRVTVSVIAGLAPGNGELGWREASPTACAGDAQGEVESDCRCFAGASALDYPLWCQFTSGAEGALACDAMEATRYTQFANAFERRSFESICRQEGDYLGNALERFALLATEACFSLAGISPADGSYQEVRVLRTARESASQTAMEELNHVGHSGERGWYYDSRENKICLSQIERRIGDRYRIFVLHEDAVDYSE